MKKINYEKFLKKNIFKTDEYFQFELLFKDFKKLNNIKYKHAAILERSYMYDNKSIFIPLLKKSKKNTSIDFKIKNHKNRRSIQDSFLKDLKIDLPKSTFWIKDLENKFVSNFKTLDNDLLIIPNSLHHISNFNLMLSKIDILMPKLKYIYIFDSYLREGHQSPNDYCRYTTYSLISLLNLYKFKDINVRETGNVFDAILYLFSQSKELLKNKELKGIYSVYNKDLKNKLLAERDKKKWVGLGRKYAKMNTAYSILFKKYA